MQSYIDKMEYEMEVAELLHKQFSVHLTNIPNYEKKILDFYNKNITIQIAVNKIAQKHKLLRVMKWR